MVNKMMMMIIMNSLPDAVVFANSFNIFKNRLDKFRQITQYVLLSRHAAHVKCVLLIMVFVW